MITPQFPDFKKIELHDKEVFNNHLRSSPLYSDFNFVSLWSWNIDNEIAFCFLNDNLVVKLADYVDNSPFLSFIGQNKFLETCEILVDYSETHGFGKFLKLIPEFNFEHINLSYVEKKFQLTEDQDNFDYILDVTQIASLSGQKLKHKRKLLNKFIRNFGNDANIGYMNINDINKHLVDFYHHWSKSKDQDSLNSNELHAVKRLIQHYHFFNTIVMSVHIQDKLIGFTLFEEISKDWALSSFQKGDISYVGIYEFLNQNLALHLQKKGIKYVNIEQDLGVPGLRRAKLDYNPTFLKKYSLSRF